MSDEILVSAVFKPQPPNHVIFVPGLSGSEGTHSLPRNRHSPALGIAYLTRYCNFMVVISVVALDSWDPSTTPCQYVRSTEPRLLFPSPLGL